MSRETLLTYLTMYIGVIASAENVEFVGNCYVHGIVGKSVCNMWPGVF